MSNINVKILRAAQAAPAGTTEVFISFPGYYGSVINDYIESEEEFTRWQLESDDRRELESIYPATSRALASGADIDDLWVYAPIPVDEIGRAYTQIYAGALESVLESYAPEAAKRIEIELEYIETVRPREYNFESDHVLARINNAALAAIYALAESEGFYEYWRERLAPRDGFEPFSDGYLLGSNAPFTMRPGASEILFDFACRGEAVSFYDCGIETGLDVPGRHYERVAAAVSEHYGAALERALEKSAAAWLAKHAAN